MAQIPDVSSIGLKSIEPTRRIGTYQAGIAQEAAAQGDATMSAATGQDYGQFAQNVQQGGNEIAQAQDMVASNAAYSSFLQKKLALDQQFQDDPNYATAPQRYSAALKEAADSSASMIASTPARAQFLDRTNWFQERGINEMQAHSRQMSIQADRNWLDQYIDGTAQGYTQAPDEAMRSQFLDSAKNVIAGMQAKGSITAGEAFQYKRSVAVSSAVARARLLPPGQLTNMVFGPKAQPGVTDSTDAGTLSRIAMLESGGNSNAVNPTTGAAGKFQFTPAVAAQYGLTDPTNDQDAASAAAALLNANRTALTKTLGRAPTPGELYLAHQQGADGAAALLKNPAEPAAQALASAYGGDTAKAQAAIVQNGGTPQMTAAQFTDMWEARFSATAPQSTMPNPAVLTAQQADGPIIPKTNTWLDFIPPATMVELLKADQSAANTKLAAFRGDVERRYNDGIAALETGQPAPNLPSHAEIAMAFPNDPGKTAALNQQADNSRQLSGYLTSLPTMSAQDRIAATKALMPDPNQSGYSERERLFGIWQKAQVNWAKRIQSDSASAMIMGNPTLKAQFDAGIKDPAQFGAYASATLKMQENAGVPAELQSVLPNDIAQSMAQSIMADPSNAPGKLAQMQKDYGSMWPHVWRDLTTIQGGLPASYQAVAVLGDQSQAAILARGLAEQGKSGKNLSDLLPPKAKTGTTGINSMVESAPDLHSLLMSLSRSGASAQMQDDTLNAVKTLAYANVVYNNADPATAADNAVKAFTSNYEFMPNGGARVPADKFDNVRQTAQQTLATLNAGKVAIPDLYGKPGMPKPDDYLRTLKAAPSWITSPKADSLWLMDHEGRIVRNSDGDPINVPFSAQPSASLGPQLYGPAHNMPFKP